jgi:Ran GTPase-activating protein (RanGAP) involved in mRNA processing and transport
MDVKMSQDEEDQIADALNDKDDTVKVEQKDEEEDDKIVTDTEDNNNIEQEDSVMTGNLYI